MPATLRLPRLRSAGEDTEPSERASASRLGLALDFVSDVGVLAFAAWTLIAYVGMGTQARVSLLVTVWLATVPLLVTLVVVLSRRSREGAALEPLVVPRRPGLVRRNSRHLQSAALAGGVISAILAATVARQLWVLVWAGALIAVAGAVVMGRLRSEGSAEPKPTFSWPVHVFAALTGLGLAAMSLFINRPNGDDAFYVNRATGTAQLNRIPVRDIIFTEERVGPVSGTGLPVDTFSALQGAVARFIDVHAASVAYYLTPPLMTFLAAWALWRLLRSWAPRNAALCFALGCVYWVFSAQLALTPGSYFLTRMWQGKVIFVAWLVPTAYVLLTRWLGRRDELTAVLLLAVGVGSIGMTASAAFVAPLLFGTAALASLACRDWRGLPVLAAAAGFPFFVGLLVSRKYPLMDVIQNGANEGKFFDASWYFHQVFGVGVLAALGLIGVWAAPLLVRSGSAARLVTGIAALSMIVLAPALIPALNHLTDLTTILRRMLWFIPLPALVGLLAAVPIAWLVSQLTGVPALARRMAAVAPALLVAGLLVVFGHPLWTSWRAGQPRWTDRPTWKMSQKNLQNARAILRRYDGTGPILAEEPTMLAIAVITVRPKAVNARGWYARFTPEPLERTRNRLALTRFVMGKGRKQSRERVLRALSDLRVGLVCVYESKPLIIREVEAVGYREAFRVRRLVCLRPPDSLTAAVGRSSSSTPVLIRGSSRARSYAD